MIGKKVFMMFSKKVPSVFYACIVLAGSWLYGCFPDRFPVSPEEYETRRPQVGFVVPANGDTVSYNTLNVLNIWFDELMDHNTIYNTVSLSLTTNDEAWTKVNFISHINQSQTKSNFLVMSRDAPGCFYSTDFGNTWIFQKSLAELNINSMHIDPVNSSIIYATTDSVILKSTNSGQSWESIYNNLPDNLIIMHFSLDVSNSSKLWIGTSAGVYNSADGGASWNATGAMPSWTNQEITQISVDPANASIIYVSTLGRFVYKSIDNGVSWEIKRGESNTLGTSRIYDIAVDPDSSNIIYAASINQGIYKSVDGGDNWLRANNGIDDVNTRIIHYHRADENRLYVISGSSVFGSDDKAISWQKVSTPVETNIISFFGDSNNSSTLFLATNSQVFKSENNGDIWDEINTIDQSSIRIAGSLTFSTWEDTLQFIVFDFENNADTLKISPYRYDDALAAYDAGFSQTPPVNPNPKATKVEFIPDEKLYKNWLYRFYIQGAFEGNEWRGENGSRDLSGMSVQYDYISYFFLK
jgi:photosystem II stability/assembly factor-like uncharacterized protein